MDFITLGIIFAVALISALYIGTNLVVFSALLIATIFFLFEPSIIFWAIFVPINLLFLIPAIRRVVVSAPTMKLIDKLGLLPKISQTEITALRAGSVWVEGEYFTGKPNFKKISKNPYPTLSDEEKLFLQNETNELCRMTNDKEVFDNRDMSDQTWEYLKKNKFLGIIIPKEYGGLGFSAIAHSEIIQKLATRSQVLAITTMVPNSLGPAELLLHYGTKEQKDHYLPRLADGTDIPCFALTEPFAGSDAGSIEANGKIVNIDGKLKIVLNFEKRYITLGAIASLIGLAFNLEDPDNLLGSEKNLGITCALVPADVEGIIQGDRHDPLGVPFVNSPLSGKNVVIDIEQIIGGKDGIGKGWKMLMESLSAGRGISLPSTSAGGVKLALSVASAYSAIRNQFGIPINKFEGVQEKLAKMAGLNYTLDAARKLVVASVDNGEKPAVTTAIMKYHSTEMFRTAINDAMDIQGGAGISLGQKNLLAHGYMGAPIAITVEGANIMTRSLIQFGQGVIRCHPYAYKEIEALSAGDTKTFDTNFFKHIGFVFTNFTRMILLSISRGYLHYPKSKSPLKNYERKLAWSSATFAFLTDLVLGYYGGALKQKESISGRFADVLSWMLLLNVTMIRYEKEGYKKEDKIYLDWMAEYALDNIQKSYNQIFKNLGSGVLNFIFKYPIGFYSRLNSIGSYPSDKLTVKLSNDISTSSDNRKLHLDGTYNEEGQLRELEETFALLEETKTSIKKIKVAIRKKILPKKKVFFLLELAREKDVITSEEFDKLKLTLTKSRAAIAVDSFNPEEYKNRKTY
ncbi:MAG: Butyryl-CoA dehydrogenase (EC [uncultured Campylobacterales bacterium]|uniref:Acyl-coenzyme A dehydrogenase n=1 Tax=uncultured Campylobacterales bacterium TaxID=352960 RepID=A0A6S6SAJ9_9BACT|nr:MAG: Butyryl-CoA dehydrogenase (EC [uncultured Campylobacterales bacterium]